MAVARTTPPRYIAAPARDSADLLRLAAGTTATGKRAHFLVLDSNPPDDIDHTCRIVAVHLNGEEADRSSKGQRRPRARAGGLAVMFELPLSTTLLFLGFPVFWVVYTLIFLLATRKWSRMRDGPEDGS